MPADFFHTEGSEETVRATWDGSPSRGILNYSALTKLALYPEALGKALKEIMSDIAARVPHHVGKAVSQRYAVGTLAAIKRRAPGTAGKFSGKGNTSVIVRGNFEENLYINFVGKVFSDWPVKAGGKRTVPRAKKVRANKKLGIKAHKAIPKYTVTREIFRGQWKEIRPTTQGVRVFAAKKKTGKGILPMAIKPGWEHPLVFGGTSIPQAIIQPETVKLWEPEVFNMIDKRIAHAVDRNLPR